MVTGCISLGKDQWLEANVVAHGVWAVSHHKRALDMGVDVMNKIDRYDPKFH
jgi:hypothetical protein